VSLPEAPTSWLKAIAVPSFSKTKEARPPVRRGGQTETLPRTRQIFHPPLCSLTRWKLSHSTCTLTTEDQARAFRPHEAFPSHCRLGADRRILRPRPGSHPAVCHSRHF